MKRVSVFIIACMVMVASPFTSPAKAAQKRVIVYGIDVSGSFSLPKKAVEIGTNIVLDMRPGDVMYALLIRDKSFGHESNLFRLALPLIPPRPTNPLDRVGWYRYQQAIQVVNVLKARAIMMIRNVKFGVARYTDIYGFLAACQDRFQAESSSSARYVVMATDAIDNRRQRSKIDLQGASVFIMVQSHGSPRQARWIQKYWQQYLMDKCNASSVRDVPTFVKTADGLPTTVTPM